MDKKQKAKEKLLELIVSTAELKKRIDEFDLSLKRDKPLPKGDAGNRGKCGTIDFTNGCGLSSYDSVSSQCENKEIYVDANSIPGTSITKESGGECDKIGVDRVLYEAVTINNVDSYELSTNCQGLYFGVSGNIVDFYLNESGVVIGYNTENLSNSADVYLMNCGCWEGCSSSSSSSSSGGGTGIPSCCTGDTLSTLTAIVNTGDNITLFWDGSTYWTGHATLTCGETLWLRYKAAGCAVSYCCDGVNWTDVAGDLPSISCSPFTDNSGWTINMNQTGTGCSSGLCGTVNVTSIHQ